VRVHLSVVYDAALALVDELDGVFNGDDVVFSLAVGLVDDGGESGRIAASRRTGHDHHSPGRSASRLTTGGSPSCSTVNISLGISRKTAPIPFFCMKKLAL